VIRRWGRPYAVVFDCGNTLIHADLGRISSALVAAGYEAVPVATLGAAMVRAGDVARFDVSRMAAFDPFYAIMAALAGLPVQAEFVLRDVCHEPDLYNQVDSSAVAALQALRASGFRIGVLANDDGGLDAALRYGGLDGLVDVSLSTADIGFEKPDARAFEAILKALDVRKQESIYIGDSVVADYLGALAAGWGRAAVFDRHNSLNLWPVDRVGDLADVAALANVWKLGDAGQGKFFDPSTATTRLLF
jgi:putative hydrolase of the HAD superfamily